MKRFVASLVRPLDKGQCILDWPFFNAHHYTRTYFDWLRDTGIDHNLTFVDDEAQSVRHAQLVAYVPDDRFVEHNHWWEFLVDVNLSHWFNTETFCSILPEDAVL